MINFFVGNTFIISLLDKKSFIYNLLKQNVSRVHIPLKAVVNSNRIRHEFPIESGARRGYDSAQRFYFIIAVSSSIL